MHKNELPKEIIDILNQGTVIPALPLALNKDRELDVERQRLLMRYYLNAGAGGVAVAVHTTQFEIRLPEFNLFESVLEIAQEEFNRFVKRTQKPIIRLAGGNWEYPTSSSRSSNRKKIWLPCCVVECRCI